MNRGANWNEIRKAVYERDNYTCRKCNKKLTKPHAHHLIPWERGGTNDLSNLLTLCGRCHIKEENQYRRVGLTNYVRRYIADNKKLIKE